LTRTVFFLDDGNMSAEHHTHHDHCSHDHGGRHHTHAPTVNASNKWRVGLAAILTMIAEVAGGLISGSLALLADAGHMLMDFAALAMAWAAFQLALRPANARFPYGYERISILVAFVNALTLFVVAGWIIWEACHRFFAPGDILAGPMLWVALAGLIVNLIVFWILMGADQGNLNIRGAVLHVLGDLLGSVAAIVAAVIIFTTGWVLADPLLSVLVAVLILRSAWYLLKDSAFVLLQGTPEHLDVVQIETDLKHHIEGLLNVQSIQIWSVTPEHPVLTLKATIKKNTNIGRISDEIAGLLKDQFNIQDIALDIRFVD